MQIGYARVSKTDGVRADRPGSRQTACRVPAGDGAQTKARADTVTVDEIVS